MGRITPSGKNVVKNDVSIAIIFPAPCKLVLEYLGVNIQPVLSNRGERRVRRECYSVNQSIHYFDHKDFSCFTCRFFVFSRRSQRPLRLNLQLHLVCASVGIYRGHILISTTD